MQLGTQHVHTDLTHENLFKFWETFLTTAVRSAHGALKRCVMNKGPIPLQLPLAGHVCAAWKRRLRKAQ
eukprot:2679347-Amphidinium_carterae.2